MDAGFILTLPTIAPSPGGEGRGEGGTWCHLHAYRMMVMEDVPEEHRFKRYPGVER
jgi:hypothetical protein